MNVVRNYAIVLANGNQAWSQVAVIITKPGSTVMLEFGNSKDVSWDKDRYGVTFVVHQDGKPIVCHVTRAAVDDNLDYSTTGTVLDRARAQFDDLAEQVRSRIESKAFEADGSIRIKTGDWRPREPYRRR